MNDNSEGEGQSSMPHLISAIASGRSGISAAPSLEYNSNSMSNPSAVKGCNAMQTQSWCDKRRGMQMVEEIEIRVKHLQWTRKVD